MLIRRCSLFSQTRLTHEYVVCHHYSLGKRVKWGKNLEGIQDYIVLQEEHRVEKVKERGMKHVAVAMMCERLMRKIIKFCTMEVKIWHHHCRIKQKYLGLGKVL